ncbi:zinc finger protein 184-like isoform X2 [Topomyia yanbarensis]|uniref:zinc finger protein 184-like isoform X2 n=1 Tax=Topomyia yanbarensis TaxID=2498891 RepID=UPI00273BEC2C|nr:zinc finger protein 184-like isoform X2 [Topomyia yanbarensis]
MSIEYDSWHLLENFENICRFCLSQENCIQILHDGRINDTLLKAADIIISKVDENDGLPNSICQRCLNCVIEFVDFESRCRETYDVLQHVIELRLEANGDGGVIEEIVFSQEYIGLEEQSSRSLKADDFIITESDKLTSSTNEVFKPTQESCRKGKCCPVCGKFVSQLSKHLPTHSDVKRHTCLHCSKQFAHDTTLRKHIRSVHLKIKRYQCQHCSESFTDRSSQRYHEVAKHKEARDYVCTLCNKSYFTSTGLQQHNSLNHEQRKFKCDQCGKMFAMKYHLKEHEYTHSDARPYKCSLCDRSFKRVKNLNEHLSIHKRGI